MVCNNGRHPFALSLSDDGLSPPLRPGPRAGHRVCCRCGWRTQHQRRRHPHRGCRIAGARPRRCRAGAGRDPVALALPRASPAPGPVRRGPPRAGRCQRAGRPGCRLDHLAVAGPRWHTDVARRARQPRRPCAGHPHRAGGGQHVTRPVDRALARQVLAGRGAAGTGPRLAAARHHRTRRRRGPGPLRGASGMVRSVRPHPGAAGRCQRGPARCAG
jgi:hypothetical protein